VAHQWFRSYLSNRHQYVELLDPGTGLSHKSSVLEVSLGVPQGSVLGPILFLLYINDLPSVVTSAKVNLFADDSCAVLSAPDFNQLTNNFDNTMSQLSAWLTVNKLKLNIDKTKLIFFNPSIPLSPVLQASVDIQGFAFTESTKFLGLHLDCHFTWRQHVDELAKKLSRSLYSLRTLSRCVSSEVLLQTYHAYFGSVMGYGVMFWGGSTAALKIFRLQKQAVRILTGCRTSRRVSCTTKFKKLNLLTLPSAYILEVSCFLRQNSLYTQQTCDVHNHNTRNRQQLRVPRCHSSVGDSICLVSGLRVYNRLPADILVCPTLSF
jgi:hypothetical protein